MGNYIKELHWVVPAYLLGYNKLVHVIGEVNISHPHVNQWSLQAC